MTTTIHPPDRRRPKRVDLDDVIGHSEAAEIVGVNRRHLGVIVVRGTFPKPIKVLAATPLYSRREVEAFAATRAAAAGALEGLA